MSVTAVSRYGFIDAIRGIAACLVMFQHSLYTSELLKSESGSLLQDIFPYLLELG